jgi:hypothetical protein
LWRFWGLWRLLLLDVLQKQGVLLHQRDKRKRQ